MKIIFCLLNIAWLIMATKNMLENQDANYEIQMSLLTFLVARSYER